MAHQTVSILSYQLLNGIFTKGRIRDNDNSLQLPERRESQSAPRVMLGTEFTYELRTWCAQYLIQERGRGGNYWGVEDLTSGIKMERTLEPTNRVCKHGLTTRLQVKIYAVKTNQSTYQNALNLSWRHSHRRACRARAWCCPRPQ